MSLQEGTSQEGTSHGTFHNHSISNSSSQSSHLDEILKLPNPKPAQQHRKKVALNKMAVCITDADVLEKLKQEENDRIE